MNHRKGFTPVALTRKEPVAKFIVYAFGPNAIFFQPPNHFLFRLSYFKAIQKITVNSRAFTGIRFTLKILRRLNRADNRQIKCLGKLPVTLILPWNCHNRAGPIMSQYIVGNPDGYLLSIYRIDGVCACKYTGFLF